MYSVYSVVKPVAASGTTEYAEYKEYTECAEAQPTAINEPRSKTCCLSYPRLAKIRLPRHGPVLGLPPITTMSINQRKHVRFSLDIPAILISKYGERQHTLLQQISIGGCFTDWEENIYAGDEFRLEIELPNKNRLPLSCKAVYRFEDTGIGVKFLNISEFEQSLVSKIIADRMDAEGVPLSVSPFDEPKRFKAEEPEPRIVTQRERQDAMLGEAMSSE